jgi:hypothetical protein
MRTEESADIEGAVAAVGAMRTAGRVVDAADLSPAGVLALQRAAGNCVARRILARDKSLDDPDCSARSVGRRSRIPPTPRPTGRATPSYW